MTINVNGISSFRKGNKQHYSMFPSADTTFQTCVISKLTREKITMQ